jgi:hypothetical protein
VNVPAGVAQFLPRYRLERGVHVADYLAVLLSDIDHHVIVFELSAEEPRVALGGIGPGAHEALRIELVVRAHQQRAKAAERRKVRGRREANGNHGTRTWSSAPYSIVRS